MGNDCDNQTRRRLLKLLGVGGIAGVSGCGQEGRNQSPTDPPASTSTETPTETRATPDTDTQTPEADWEVTPIEHDKLVGAFYYPWYRDQYWNTYPIPGTPVLGQYDSRNPAVINQHIKWSVEHGINTWIVNWNETAVRETWIEDHFSEAELSNEISFLLTPSMTPGTHRYVWDGNRLDFDNPDNRRQLRSEFERFSNRYFSRPNYRTIDGKPVVYQYLAGRVFTGDIAGAFREAQEAIDTDVYLIADLLDTPWVANVIHRDWLAEFDAVSAYNLYSADVAAEGDFETFLRYAERKVTEWNLLAKHADIDFIPSLVPGFNDSLFRNHPVLERSPGGFDKLSRMIMNRLDPELEAIFITSFNEWPEYTAVEPAEEYGETYLKIVRDEIAAGNPSYLDTSEFDLLQFDFNKTIKPKNHNPSSNDSRDLAFLLTELVVGDGVVEYNVGIPEAEPYFVEGAYSPGGDQTAKAPSESGRWLGGPTEQSAVYIDATDAGMITIRGEPMINNEIKSDIYFNRNFITKLSLGKRDGEPNEYTIEL